MPSQEVGLAIARVGLASQFATTVLLMMLFLLLRQQSRRHTYFLYWTWAWVMLAFGLLALFVQFYYLNLTWRGVLEGESGTRLANSLYQFGKIAFLVFILAGVLNYARGTRSGSVVFWGLSVALLFAVLTFSFTQSLAQAVRWQVPITVAAYAAGSYIMLALPRSRRTLGSRVTGINLSAFALVWAFNLLAFSPLQSMGESVMLFGDVMTRLSLYNAFVDQVLEMLLAFGMVLILHEDTRREVEAAHAELALAHQELKSESLRDSLTRALNRRAFNEGAGLRAARASYGTVIVFDLDNLKRVNDSHGHQAGDRLLRYFVEVVRPNMRPSDKLYRFGGDEFLLVMPRAKRTDVVPRFQRLLTQVEPLPLHQSEDISLRLEVSMGAASYESGDQLEAAVNEADREMYRNKHQSKLLGE